MATPVRERLKELNAQCEAFCREDSNWSHLSWRGFERNDPKKTANFRLINSSPETFERHGRVMIVGTNPGGSHRDARLHDPWLPFKSGHRYSAYLEDAWSHSRTGEHPTQRAVKAIAAAIAGKPNLGDRLLKSAPTGNLIPFRSKTSEKKDLPDEIRNRGLKVGEVLIDLARPCVLIWIASNVSGWRWLMQQVGHKEQPDHEHPFWVPNRDRPYLFREANTAFSADWPQVVFALPGLNSTRKKLLRIHPKVLQHFEERMKFHGLAGA